MDYRVNIFVIFLALISVVGSVSVDPSLFPGEACYRDCSVTLPRICYFKFHLEHYQVLGQACKNCMKTNSNMTECFLPQCITADGIERGLMTVNRELPGPAIHVCQNDKIVVDVVNMMAATAATIHWHGFTQKQTPYMDGVPFVTQCPIPYGTTFRYQMPVDEFGTMWYHSHAGMQKVNGVYGGLVIRQPRKLDPLIGYYDYDLKEHLILISDWMEVAVEQFTPGLRSQRLAPSNLLINGRGAVILPDAKNQFAYPKTSTPLSVFRVQRGKRYRFRVINTMNHPCPAVIEVEKHSLLAVSSDSSDFEPVIVNSIVTQSGERYDFILETNQVKGTYWIRIKGIGVCEGYKSHQLAVLAYADPAVSDAVYAYPTKKFPTFETSFGKPIYLNHQNTQCYTKEKSDFCITDLNSYYSKPDVTDVKPDQTIVLGFDLTVQPDSALFGKGIYKLFTDHGNNIRSIGAVDNITMQLPPFSLLTQRNLIKENMFCDLQNMPASCNGVFPCPCIHRIKIKLNAVVEMIIVDESPDLRQLFHPFHIHGYQVSVMGVGQSTDPRPMTVTQAMSMIRSRSYTPASGKNYILKDTVSIPSKGFTIFRFRADNPGFWFFHCHYEWHSSTGMSAVFQVGEHSDMVPTPANFPTCNNFMTQVEGMPTKRLGRTDEEETAYAEYEDAVVESVETE